MNPLDTLLGDNSPDEQFPAASAGGKAVRSPPPPPGTKLSPTERKVWDYICQALREEGLPHLTAGIAIAVVCKTFIRWVRAEAELQNFEAGNNNSFMVVTPNGHSQPHQLYFVTRTLKGELLKWLPESCLTLPSSVMARAKLGDEGMQDDLFGDLLEHARAERTAVIARAAQGSKLTA